VMKAARLVYRARMVEPLLLVLIGFQLVSGFLLARRKLERPADLFGTLQTLTGIYVGIYLLGHMTAAFSARGQGTDTNWNWLTDNDHGLLDHLGSFSLVGHYWVGPIAIIAHVACGLRVVMLEHGVSNFLASRLASILIGLGVVVSSIILAGLLGAHIA
jgi:succinate dehydrogenase/fumarate reductase cytochrome b subunit